MPPLQGGKVGHGDAEHKNASTGWEDGGLRYGHGDAGHKNALST